MEQMEFFQLTTGLLVPLSEVKSYRVWLDRDRMTPGEIMIGGGHLRTITVTDDLVTKNVHFCFGRRSHVERFLFTTADYPPNRMGIVGIRVPKRKGRMETLFNHSYDTRQRERD